MSTDGLLDERPRDRDALTLAAAELVGIRRRVGGRQRHSLEHLGRPRGGVAGSDAPAIRIGRATESPTVRRGCSELYGFWNTYWIESRCAVGRSRDDVGERLRR